MPDTEPRLSLSEWLVLCLISEKPVHGFAVVALLACDGSIGRVWQVPKPVVYRGLHRLESLGLVRAVGEEHSRHGPVRMLSEAIPAGRTAANTWLTRPVTHARSVRSELLVKLALLDRAGLDPQELLRAQRAQLAPIAAALDDRLRAAEGFEYTLTLWRHEAMSAAMRFLGAVAPAG